MKKIFLSLFAIAISCLTAWAVPADPTPFKYTQPDGTVITLQLHGDEFFHWITNYITGEVVVRDASGYYRPSLQNFQAMATEAQNRRDAQFAVWSSYENPPETNFGDRKVLCIIANFTNISFTVEDPQAHFSNMLNQEGYSNYGAIGSVRDYYIDNSLGQYRPSFDVYGPVTLGNTESYYKSKGVDLAIVEAYESMQSQINIADYDTDGNGSVDMVLFYFPGYNEAEGGGEDTIWPHQSGSSYMLGDKSLPRYFCTSELYGNTSRNPDKIPAAIGTTCHEFAHSLGLPDFYDVDYTSSGGQNYTTGAYDLMSSGNYNDNGCRPPYLSALERNMLGWANYPESISEGGSYTLKPVQENKGYQINTSISGEYFILESRNGEKWDSGLPSTGLLVYHVDKSSRIVGGGRSAAYLWNYTNNINNYYGHPCYRLVTSAVFDYDQTKTNSYVPWNLFTYPGPNNYKTFIPQDWDGNEVGISLSAIAHDGVNSTFSVNVTSNPTVFGYITDTDGTPLEGVQVSLTPSETPFAAAPSLLSGSIFCTTDAQGYYSLTLEDSSASNQILLAEKEGYVSTSVNLTLSSLYTTQDICLFRKGEGPRSDLIKYDFDKGMPIASLGSGDVAVGMKYTAEELVALDAVGAQLRSVTFALHANQGESVYVIVDFGENGSETILRKNVSDQYVAEDFVTVDLTGENILLPAGKDVFIGVGLANIPSTEDYHPFFILGPEETSNGGNMIRRNFLQESSSWQSVTFGGNIYNFLVSAEIGRTASIEFSALGVSYIKLVENVPSVQVAAGKSLRSITWTLDGESVAEPVDITTLAAGSHTYMARLLYYDGTAERVYYDFER